MLECHDFDHTLFADCHPHGGSRETRSWKFVTAVVTITNDLEYVAIMLIMLPRSKYSMGRRFLTFVIC